MKLPNKLRDLPESENWLKMVGPGAIMLATSMGSGEVYFWPNLSAKYGPWVLLIAFLAITIQYVINTEVSRYTITTGETIIHGFQRLWSPLPWIILACCTLPWIWPGWSMGGATAISWLIGGNVVWYGVLSLLLSGILLSVGRTLYKSLEITQIILLGAMIPLMFIVFAYTNSYIKIPELVTTINSENIKGFLDIDIAVLLAAFAFCGAGGTINLTQSHYVKEKGFGMAKYTPPLNNPLSKDFWLGLTSSLFNRSKDARNSLSDSDSENTSGYLWNPTDSNVKRWKDWWFEVRKEQLFSFLFIGIIGLVVLSLIASSLIGNSEPQSNMKLLLQEMTILGTSSTFFSKIFGFIVAIVFFTSEIGVLDHVCRLTSDIALKKGIANNHPLRKEGAIYLYMLWLMVIGGIFILLVLNINQPPRLLVIAGSLSGIAMFIYSVSIILLNIFSHKEWRTKNENGVFSPFVLPKWRWIMLVLAGLIFGIFSVLFLISKFG